MKVALAFAGGGAGDAAYRPHRSPFFVDALAAEGVDGVLVDLAAGEGSRVARGAGDAAGADDRNPIDRLAALVAQERPALVQTFGAMTDLAPVWRAAAQATATIVHYVSSEDSPAQGFAQRIAALPARLASRHVAGVIGSNRADLGRRLSEGYFPRARFTAIAPPPTEPPAIEAFAPGPADAGKPVFGFFDPDASGNALQFLLRAFDLTGAPDPFDLRIAPAALAARAPGRAAQASFVDAADAAAFLRGVDALLAPEAHDRALPAIAVALAMRKVVVVPDSGAASELVEYGRHGVLFPAGSAYHLAMAINVMAQSWTNRPFAFAGVEAAIARTSRQAVARAFAAAYRRIARET